MRNGAKSIRQAHSATRGGNFCAILGHMRNINMRNGVSVKDVSIVYCSLIRSLREYACMPCLALWSYFQGIVTSSDIEGVQRRVLRIVWPDLRYSEALNRAGLERLDTKRGRSLFGKLLSWSGNWGMFCMICCLRRFIRGGLGMNICLNFRGTTPHDTADHLWIVVLKCY